MKAHYYYSSSQKEEEEEEEEEELQQEQESPYKKASATSLILRRDSAGSSDLHNINHNSSVFGKTTRYKLWALLIILALAFWSMFTGSLTLNWSSAAANLADDFDSPLHSDLDILEVEEREIVVRRMWDVYTHSRSIQLPNFWQHAFKAAYEDLISDLPSVRNAAVSEIAKMSLLSLDVLLLQPPPAAPLHQSSSTTATE